jgi:ankyrin repeat protein
MPTPTSNSPILTALLRKAVLENNLLAAKNAIENGADPSARTHGNSLLTLAVNSANLKMCELLLKHGASLIETAPCSNVLLLHVALAALKAPKKIVYEIIAQILQHASPDERAVLINEGGSSILHQAIRCNHGVRVCELLVRFGASVDAIDDNGATVLHHLASRRARPAVLSFLLRKGAPVNAVAGCGAALHCAIEAGNTQALRQLLTSGANPNLTTADGETALHAAAIHGNRDTIMLLLSHGADVLLKNKTGLTAEKHALIVNNLETYGAIRQAMEGVQLSHAVPEATPSNRVRI